MKNNQFIDFLPLLTDRLVIKSTTVNDIDLILKLDKQEKTQMFLGGIKNKTYDERIMFLKKKEEKFKKGIVSSLTVYLESIPIGFIGIKINEELNEGELSYIFDFDYTKCGYCYESSKKIIDVCFKMLNLKCIKADTLLNNYDSIKVLKKLGFEETGTLKNEEEIEFKCFILKNSNM